MGVHVIERQIGCPKSSELGSDLRLELATHSRDEEESDPGSRHVGVEACAADEIGYFALRQHRPAIHQDQVQADAKAGQTAGAGHRIGRGLPRDHQTSGGQDAVSMGFFDCLVDRRIEAEIIGTDDQALQLAISRPRRNWKNSTPSRSRRRIICGLFTISATSEAIF
jgi:hypothetical protein